MNNYKKSLGMECWGISFTFFVFFDLQIGVFYCFGDNIGYLLAPARLSSAFDLHLFRLFQHQDIQSTSINIYLQCSSPRSKSQIIYFVYTFRRISISYYTSPLILFFRVVSSFAPFCREPKLAYVPQGICAVKAVYCFIKFQMRASLES